MRKSDYYADLISRLTPWELVVLELKFKGASQREIAHETGNKVRVVEMLLGNVYDKLGLSYYDNRSRKDQLAQLAATLRSMIRSGELTIHAVSSMKESPTPEVPSQRAMAEVRNDERFEVWPFAPLRREDPFSAQQAAGPRQESAEDGSPHQTSNDHAGTSPYSNWRDFAWDNPASPEQGSRARFIKFGAVAFVAILSCAGILLFAGVLLDSTEPDGQQDDSGVAGVEQEQIQSSDQPADSSQPDSAKGTEEPAVGVQDIPAATAVPDATPTPYHTATPSPTVTPMATPTPLPRADRPGEPVFSASGGDFSEWELPDHWQFTNGMIVHDGSLGGSSAVLVPAEINHPNIAVELEVRMHSWAGRDDMRSFGTLMRMTDNRFYDLSLSGQFDVHYSDIILASWDGSDESETSFERVGGISLGMERYACRNQWCVVRFETNGNRLSIYIGDELAVEAFDNRHLSEGAIGIFSYGIQIEVRSVRVYAMPFVE